MRRLIVNADDFGFTSGVNRAIIEAHIRGVVTSSTLMANGPAFADAVQLAATAPQLDIGCHVVLIDAEPVLSARQLPSLTTKASSRFRDGLKTLAARAIAGRMNPDELVAEATAQIRKLQSAGIVVSHLDTHKTHPSLPEGSAASAPCGLSLRGPRTPQSVWPPPAAAVEPTPSPSRPLDALRRGSSFT